MMDSTPIKESIMDSLLHFAFAGARGIRVTSSPTDWNAFVNLAIEHKVTALVACALLHSTELDCPASSKEYLLNTVRFSAAANLVRRQRILGLIDALSKDGFRVQVLKGYAVAECYAHPECREAIDADVLIDPYQEGNIYEYLLSKGFSVSQRSSTSHHGVCQHPKYGVIEIHVRLYDEIVEEIWFRGMKYCETAMHPPSIVRIDHYNVPTLNETDQLIFLSLHMVKHFISGGISIRMLLDIALWFANNGQKIDSGRYWNVMERLKYKKLINCILGIAILYGGFEQTDFPGMEPPQLELIKEILVDLERGGYMGSKEIEERHESSMEYNRILMRKENSYVQYLKYMILWKVRSASIHMFPGKKQLINKYPFASKSLIHEAAARLYQACSYPIEKISTGIIFKQIRTETTFITQIAKERLRLIKDLDMV